ncbi:Stk1 family PASTA domain-containing Ser/Thr kinase [Lysinimonas soli]|uniref:non-specific serine/threonine protein kinase n=1 Tax=Lysinimonas soli TaxID=1074233 RepID=A0ABW0NRJ6_9MICO
MSVNTSDPMIGRLIDGRYQVRSRIARGGMATVYLATDLRLERRVAVKVMHGHLADDSQFKQRFIQEARSAARLAHPNVVNVFDQGQDSDSAYLVMEYLPGITLRDLLQEYGSLTPQQTIDITEAVLSGLAAAHKAGIVHRDLKPENVLLADDGRIKIGDFGLARAASANTATGAALLGTIAYLSPELVTRGVADARSDIYAVGIMMYEMLTGEQPFKGEQPMQIAYQHANDTVPTPSAKNSKVPAELDELVVWATARDPEERPRDARVMLDQLHDTESLLRTALPTGATAAQRTMVLPSAPAETTFMGTRAEAETQIITPRAPAAPVEVSDSTSALARVSQKRRGRGLALFLVILLLAAAAGAAGWYFGAGPGSKVTIPRTLAGLSTAAATEQLTKLGLKVNPSPGEAFSTTVAAGAVAETAPAMGQSVVKGGMVQLLLSKGPQPFPLPTLVGQTEKDALDLVSTHWKAGDSIRQFDGTVASGTVLDALDASGKSLKGVGQYGDQQKIVLVVSAGPLPSDLSGKSMSEATAELAADPYKLTVSGNVDVFSQTVPKGAVVGLVTTDSAGKAIPIRVGDKVQLQTSKGPEQVPVPDVTGKTWATAKQMLTDAGFQLSYNKLADIAPSSITVSKTNPPAGTTVDKGSTIKVNFNGF